MNEQQKENKQTVSNKSKRKTYNFFIQELKKRAEIKQKANVFKAMVDAEKEQELLRIESDSKHREEDILADVSALESALSADDAEQIKTALKNLQI